MDLLKNSFFSSSNQKICILLEQTETENPTSFLEPIQKEIFQRFHQKFIFGIGSLVTTDNDLWLSNKEAETVVSWSLYAKDTVIKCYEALDIELILATLPAVTAETLLQKTFKGISDNDLEQYQEVFDAYVRNNGSIINGAKELFIHKNTFQNKLNRIHEKTGYNPRELTDFSVLYIAFRLRNYLNFTQKK